MDTHLGNDFSKLNCSESSLQSDERVDSSSYDQVKASDEFVLCGITWAATPTHKKTSGGMRAAITALKNLAAVADMMWADRCRPICMLIQEYPTYAKYMFQIFQLF
jgi:hypothetical protein